MQDISVLSDISLNDVLTLIRARIGAGRLTLRKADQQRGNQSRWSIQPGPGEAVRHHLVKRRLYRTM